MNPRLIKLASSSTIYANLDLIKFIKQKISQAGEEIKPADNIYFFKDVNFRRDLLNVSQERFSRVIKLEKANVVVVNTQLTLPGTGYFLKGNQIFKPGDLEPHLAEDTLFNISQYGVDYMTTMKQWFELSQLTNQSRIVHEQDILKFVNSGIVINEENYESIVDLIKSDIAIATKLIDTCKIEESFHYILGLIYFENGFLQRSDRIYGSLDNVRRFLGQRNCGNTIPDKYIQEILDIEFLKDRITAVESQRLLKVIQQTSSNSSKYITDINIDFGWKKQ